MTTSYFPLYPVLTFKETVLKEININLMSQGCLQEMLREKISMMGYFPRNNATILLTIMSSSSVDIL